MNISPDGRWIGSNDGNEYTMIYDRVGGGEPVMYSETMLGNGNAIALNGMAVGATFSDRPVLMYEEEVLFPAVFDNYSLADLEGITADANASAASCQTRNQVAAQTRTIKCICRYMPK